MTPKEIKELRKKLNMSRSELALALKCSSLAIFLFEKGELDPNEDIISKMKKLKFWADQEGLASEDHKMYVRPLDQLKKIKGGIK